LNFFATRISRFFGDLFMRLPVAGSGGEQEVLRIARIFGASFLIILNQKT
jgi:hypothetical protein